jgi:hypothetical protein
MEDEEFDGNIEVQFSDYSLAKSTCRKPGHTMAGLFYARYLLVYIIVQQEYTWSAPT